MPRKLARQGQPSRGSGRIRRSLPPSTKAGESGYVQPLDFFGDGTPIPLNVVSKYSTGGHISHSYGDHVSIDKFIEANWGLPPITGRSRDNLPNPKTGGNPHIPVNSPAIGDLMDTFKFK